MEQSFLKTYSVKLSTVTPVFIGSGKTIGKKEYIYNKNQNKVYIPNMNKLFQGLKKYNLLKEYEDYMLNNRLPTRGNPIRRSVGGKKKNQPDGLMQFLKACNVPQKEYESWCERVEDVGDIDAKDRSLKEISTFVKDAYGKPYVPGTSIKGALRTILLSYYILEDEQLQKEYEQRLKRANVRNLSREEKQLEQQLLHERRMGNQEAKIADKVNDIMAAFHVSDSEPIEPENLCLCQKVDLNMNGSRRPINTLRESLKPGTDIEFTITIDTGLFPTKMKKMSVMQKAIRKFWDNYKTEYMNCFEFAPPIPDDFYSKEKKQKEKKQYFILLGGGVGYPSKTVTYAIVHGKAGIRQVSQILDARLGGKAKREHDHKSDVKKGASPHVLKCTIYNGELMQMGVCKMTRLKQVENCVD